MRRTAPCLSGSCFGGALAPAKSTCWVRQVRSDFGESSQGGRLGRVDHQRILGKGMWWWLGWLRVTEMVPASTWPAMRKNSFLKNCTCQHGHPQRKFHQIPDPPFHTLILTPVSESSFLMTLLLFKLLPLYRGLRVRKSVCEPFQSRLWISHGPLVLPDIAVLVFKARCSLYPGAGPSGWGAPQGLGPLSPQREPLRLWKPSHFWITTLWG